MNANIANITHTCQHARPETLRRVMEDELLQRAANMVLERTENGEVLDIDLDQLENGEAADGGEAGQGGESERRRHARAYLKYATYIYVCMCMYMYIRY